VIVAHIGPDLPTASALLAGQDLLKTRSEKLALKRLIFVGDLTAYAFVRVSLSDGVFQ